MIPKTKRIHEFLKGHAGTLYSVSEIAAALDLDYKQVTNGLRQLQNHNRLVGVTHVSYGAWTWEPGHEKAPLPWTPEQAVRTVDSFIKVSWHNDTPDVIVALFDSLQQRVVELNKQDVFVHEVGQWSFLVSEFDEMAGEPKGPRWTIPFEDVNEVVFY